MEAAGETGEGHPGHRTVNDKACHIVLNVEHVEHDMDERTKTAILNEETCREGEATMEYKRDDTNGEQTENVIETECLGEELPEVLLFSPFFSPFSTFSHFSLFSLFSTIFPYFFTFSQFSICSFSFFPFVLLFPLLLTLFQSFPPSFDPLFNPFPPFCGQDDASLVPYEAPPTHRILRRVRHIVKENLFFIELVSEHFRSHSRVHTSTCPQRVLRFEQFSYLGPLRFLREKPLDCLLNPRDHWCT